MAGRGLCHLYCRTQILWLNWEFKNYPSQLGLLCDCKALLGGFALFSIDGGFGARELSIHLTSIVLKRCFSIRLWCPRHGWRSCQGTRYHAHGWIKAWQRISDGVLGTAARCPRAMGT